MKVLLVFPPQWIPAMPHLALPVLSGYLRSHGVQVIQRDLNLETYDAILRRAHLEQVIERLRTGFNKVYPRGLPGKFVQALEQKAGLAAQVDQAKAIFRSPAFYDGETSLAAFGIIGQALELASLPFTPSQLDLFKYVSTSPVDNSQSLLQGVQDRQHNMFIDLFKRLILPDLLRENPDLVGISIPSGGQMLAGMTLAHLIKQAGLKCHVTVGGPQISMLRDQLPRIPALFSLIDSAIVFDGELPLLRLTETLDGKGDLSGVPNLIYKAGEQILVNPASPRPHQHPGETSSTSDFDGLPLDRYLAPELVLPLITAHGCYHGQCAFCNVGYGGGKGFYPLPVEQVLDQIETLRQKYGVRHIFFSDEAIPPRTLRLLSELLAAQGAPIDWCGCARFEKTLTKSLLEGIARGGGRMLFFGLETASERMIEQMVKGTQRETMSRILKECAQAGVWNHSFYFFGFPTETLEDAKATLNFISAHHDSINSASPGEFVLERYSPVYLDPARFGVRRILEKPELDLAIYFDYELTSGIDNATAHNLVKRLYDVFPSKRFFQYYIYDVYRFLYASHLHDRGQALPLWLERVEAGSKKAKRKRH
jgi:anaerobic magnesium-protoporphyrin IX monomethyl ester cyclase